MSKRTLLISAVFVSAIAPSAIALNTNIARAYVLALVTATEAEQRCIGMTADESVLMRLSFAADRRAADDGWMGREIAATKPKIQSAIQKAGAAEWCAAVWETFGPSGIKTIKRK